MTTRFKLTDWIKALYSDFLDSLNVDIAKIKNGSNIDYSTDEYLEAIRSIENAQSGTTEDETRKLIYGKIAEKNSNGTFFDIVNIIETVVGGRIKEFRKRFDAVIDEGVTYPEIVADCIRAGKAAGVQANIYEDSETLFILDVSELDVGTLGGRL